MPPGNDVPPLPGAAGGGILLGDLPAAPTVARGVFEQRILEATKNQSDLELVSEWESYQSRYEAENFSGMTLRMTLAQSRRPLTLLSIWEGKVVAVHCIVRYMNEIGHPEQPDLHERDFAVMGDQVGALYQIVRGPRTQGSRLENWLTPTISHVPTDAEIAPVVNGTARLVAPGDQAAGIQRALPSLLLIPPRWGCSFLKRQSLPEAWALITALRGQLDPALQPRVQGILDWFKLAMTKANEEDTASVLELRWQPVALAPALMQLMQARVDETLPLPLPPPPPPLPPMFPPGWGGQAATNGPTMVSFDPDTLSRLERKKDDRKLTEGEKSRIRGACSLKDDEFEGLIPQFYRDWARDGKTKAATRSWLEFHLNQDAADPTAFPVSVYVSDDLVTDVKNLDFARGGSLAYLDCHRGLTPFMCPAVPARRRQELQRRQERQDRATLLTPADIADTESAPGKAPRSYYEMLQQLMRYAKVLRVLAGNRSSHLLKVQEIIRVISRQADRFDELRPAQLLGIMWTIHSDARSFFRDSAPVGSGDHALPASSLQVARTLMASGSLLTPIGCPTDEFLGQHDDEYVQSTLTSGSGSPPMFKPAYQGPYSNSNLPPQLKTVAADFRKKCPGVTVTQLLDAYPDKFSLRSVQLGRAGHHCINYNVVGHCADPTCNYAHQLAKPTAERLTKVVGTIKPILKQAITDGLKATNKRKRN